MKTLFFSIKKITSALAFTLMLIAVTAYSYGGERDLNVSYRTPEDINAFLQSHPVAHDAFSESYEFSYSDAPRLSSSYEPGSLSKSDLNGYRMRELAEQKYTWKRIAQQYYSLY